MTFNYMPFTVALLLAACGDSDSPVQLVENRSIVAKPASPPVIAHDEGSGDAAYDAAVAADTPPDGVGDDDLAYEAAESVVSEAIGGSSRGQMVDGWMPLMKLCLALDPTLAGAGDAVTSTATLAHLALRGHSMATGWEHENGTVFVTSRLVDDSGQRVKSVTSLNRDYTAAPGCPAGSATVISVTVGNEIGSAEAAADMYQRLVSAASSK